MNAKLIVRHIGTGCLAVDAEWIVRMTNTRASMLLRRRSVAVRMRKKGDTFEAIAAQLGTSGYQVAKVYANFSVTARVETKIESSTG